MRKSAFLGAAAAALAVASPAFAQNSGYVGLSYSNISASGGGDDLSSLAVGGAAALGEHLQIDGRYAHLETDGGEADAWNIGGHLFVRDAQWLWGGYVGYNGFEEGGTLDEWTVAGQAQFYLTRTTLSVTGGYTNVESGEADMWALDGEARHFITDNFSIQGNAGFMTIESSGGGESDGWTGGLGAEFQPNGAPFSIHGGWQHGDFDGGDTDSIGIGGRLTWGGTLMERNRSGAGLNRPAGFIERVLADLSPR